MVQFNGRYVTGIVFNGQPVKNLVYNGTHIWCVPPTASSVYFLRKSGTYYYPTLTIYNNSSLEIVISYGSTRKYAPPGGSATFEASKLTSLPAVGTAKTWSVMYGGEVETCVHPISFTAKYDGIIQA